MFGNIESECAASLSEKGLISRIMSAFGDSMPPAPFGGGDDCAVINKSLFQGKILSTSDAVIARVHFLESDPPELVGQKLLNRNISDIAAMGGDPKFAMTSSIISPKLKLSWLDGFCAGLKAAAEKWGVKFVGGDVAKGGDDFFSTHITLLGDAEKPLLRCGAKEGDSIFTTGALGASFESGRHLTFVPRVAEGKSLASFGGVNCCTDLSDGLASDIYDILPKNLCAVFYAEKIPLCNFAGNSIKKALYDGEDYELLFSLSAGADKAEFLRQYKNEFGVCPFEIGEFRAPIAPFDGGLALLKRGGSFMQIPRGGYSHFA
ncbi:MAG: thiamine-monophosphate kinase [Opitutales bacterium]|nr:thiamine-monophosphate kinase [Opitutales bacterium]